MSMRRLCSAATQSVRAFLLRDGAWPARVIPLALSAAVVLGSMGVVWARVHPPPNLARKARVSSSSVAFSTAPEGAVDGYRYGQLGFHSDLEVSPWLALDFGSSQSITRVEAYGRGDCCYDQSVPLALEASEDGVSYRNVATRTAPFRQVEPWIVRFKDLQARYLRFRTAFAGPTNLVLGEVEVYGHPSTVATMP